MSIAPPPPAYPTRPPRPYPPVPSQHRRRWPAVAASASVGALISGTITTLVTMAATAGSGDNTAGPTAAPTVTVTATPPKPTPLPVAEADKQTCHAWGTADNLVTAAAYALNVIPQGMPFTDPAVRDNAAWKAGVKRASDLYAQAADVFASQIAPGTSQILAEVSDTTVSSLRTLSEAYKSFDPDSDKAVAVFQASQKALDWICFPR
ncbi:hypothetical protein MSM1_20320 [Mycobacterium sp. SM1]|uniref:hypothetical protein n=1 Tax=Mycobacterium sp. SM1 TaxID=2816243 RepID=UPI001BCE934A|nr:hypothetical protein [Mycobacterium sp. SM1]MBS4730565.1 hypothetical protein [Mycobacterium sp. SM1]